MRVHFVLCACALAAMAAAPWAEALAARTQVFRLEKPGDFRKSRMNGVTLDADARIAPGPAAHAIADAGAQVWSLLETRDGTLYAASGSDGLVHVLRGDKATGSIETSEFEVFAVAEGKNGTIVAGGAPNGTILVLGKPGEAPRTLFDTPEKIVWAMVSDTQGNIYAATGDRGILYKVTPAGDAKVLYRAEDSHLLSLAWSPDGKLLAGTGGRGLLLSIDPETGGGRVLYDASGSEVTRIATLPDGSIYFAVAGDTRGSSRPPQDAADDAPEGKDDSGSGSGGITIPEVVVSAPTGVRVYVRRPDGTVLPHWLCPEENIHALVARKDGSLLVGTGERAALYRIEANGDPSLLWKPEEGQVLALLEDADGILAATGNPGRVYRLDGRHDGEAWIRPEPLDAGSMARWGRASWQATPGSGRWEIRTRSGHTERPDSSWSGWSDPLTDPAGSPVASPPARYLQIEARFAGESGPTPSRLARIWIPFAEPNRAPRVANVRFSDPAASSRESADAPGGSYTQNLGGGVRVQIQRGAGADTRGADLAPGWVQAVRSIAWDAEDPDGDRLIYDVGLRRVGEQRFREVGSDLEVSAIGVDVSTLPEGEYEVRITASDELANPPGEAARAERVSGAFRVDHQAPSVDALRVTRPDPKTIDVEGSIKDASSPIVRLEISVDGDPWRPLAVSDGFLDSMEETFRTTVDLDDEKDGNWVAVRGADAAGNEAARQVWIPEK